MCQRAVEICLLIWRGIRLATAEHPTGVMATVRSVVG